MGALILLNRTRLRSRKDRFSEKSMLLRGRDDLNVKGSSRKKEKIEQEVKERTLQAT